VTKAEASNRQRAFGITKKDFWIKKKEKKSNLRREEFGPLLQVTGSAYPSDSVSILSVFVGCYLS